MNRTELWLFWAAGMAAGLGVAFIVIGLGHPWLVCLGLALELMLLAWSWVMYLVVTDDGEDGQ